MKNRKVVNKGILIVIFALSICICSMHKTVFAAQSTQFDLYMTEEPISSPTETPTASPTTKPTETQTAVPTTAPTENPSGNSNKNVTDNINTNSKTTALVNTGNETAWTIYFTMAMLSCTAALSVLIISKKRYRK